MATIPTSPATTRIADRLNAARRGRFVGRAAELHLFQTALNPTAASFVVLHVYGPGGIGKTTLLREYEQIARERGRTVIRLDCRNVEASPPGFMLALRQAINPQADPLTTLILDWPPHTVLFLDTYEALGGLDGWLRETFLPQLPADALIVTAGRNQPDTAWRTDIAWADLTQLLPLHNLQPEESQAYLAGRGVPAEQQAAALEMTHGHPLALCLVADVLNQNEQATPISLRQEPDVVRVLLQRFVQDMPSVQHRYALELCVQAWATTETLLETVLGDGHGATCFRWLEQLSFIEKGTQGLFPHDLARDVLAADLRWRNRQSFVERSKQLVTFLHERVLKANRFEQQRFWFDLLYLSRHNPAMKPYFEWAALGTTYAEPATAADQATIVAMVTQHEGEASAQIAQHWLKRQPEAFLVFRTLKGETMGFLCQLALHLATEEDRAVDPAAAAAFAFADQFGPLRPGEEMCYLRFWMEREKYQAVSSALNMTAINSSIYWTTHPKLAWSFAAMSNPRFMVPHFRAIHIELAPEAGFTVGGRSYGVFTHDWRVEGALEWLNIKHELTDEDQPEGTRPRTKPAPSVVVLSQEAFAEAVRQALRDMSRPDLLADNPLLKTRLLGKEKAAEARVAYLQEMLRHAAATLLTTPKDAKLHRALWITYFEPAATQEQAAEQLDLPFSTYRYHLSKGLERIVAWLWQRELQS